MVTYIDLIFELKQKVENKIGISSTDQRLKYNGKELNNVKTIFEM